MKKILFHIGHPAHFQLFKNVILDLKAKGHTCYILIKKKDILEDLLIESGLDYINILPEGKKKSKLDLIFGMLKRDWRMFRFCLKNRPDILIGTSVEISHVGTLLRIPSINVEEDDAAVIPLHAKFSYPFSTEILTPTICDNGKWNKRSIKYNGYHELTYLHPTVFTPSKEVVKKYFDPGKPYFIMRFVALTAHHDAGIKGINTEIASKIIAMLKPYGDIYITSERPLEPEFEEYRLAINPLDIHHVMAYSKMLIGDSQTMAAEAGVLGIPYIRFNDFVGRISYLEELENIYNLGKGIMPSNIDGLYQAVEDYLKDENLEEKQKQRLQKMLDEKIDVKSFFVWLLEEYPSSAQIVKKDSTYISNHF
jgi:predicted glycosyltransferase